MHAVRNQLVIRASGPDRGSSQNLRSFWRHVSFGLAFINRSFVRHAPRFDLKLLDKEPAFTGAGLGASSFTSSFASRHACGVCAFGLRVVSVLDKEAGSKGTDLVTVFGASSFASSFPDMFGQSDREESLCCFEIPGTITCTPCSAECHRFQFSCTSVEHDIFQICQILQLHTTDEAILYVN